MRQITDLEERLASAARDCKLIQQEVSDGDLNSAQIGLSCVIRDLSELRDALDGALSFRDRYYRKRFLSAQKEAA